MPNYALNLQVKKFVAVVKSNIGMRFMVFTTGDERYYLFSQIDRSGCQTGLQWPVRKRDLRRDMAHALANGWGNATLRDDAGPFRFLPPGARWVKTSDSD